MFTPPRLFAIGPVRQAPSSLCLAYTCRVVVSVRCGCHLRNEIKCMGVTTNFNELLLSCDSAMPVCCSQSLWNRCVKSFGIRKYHPSGVFSYNLLQYFTSCFNVKLLLKAAKNSICSHPHVSFTMARVAN